jgi:hypothetical protein
MPMMFDFDSISIFRETTAEEGGMSSGRTLENVNRKQFRIPVRGSGECGGCRNSEVEGAYVHSKRKSR